MSINVRTRNILNNKLYVNKHNRIMTCETIKKVYDKLLITHEENK